MRVSIGRSEIRGSVRAPSSKSYTIRGLMCAALAKGTSELVYPLLADDTEAALGVLRAVGVDVDQGDTWKVCGGRFVSSESELNCRESAATLRFMTAVAATIPGNNTLVAKPSLARRPISPLIDSLRQLGVECGQDMERARISVKGMRLRGGEDGTSGEHKLAICFCPSFDRAPGEIWSNDSLDHIP